DRRVPEAPPLVMLNRQLRHSTADTARWPDDREWAEAWLSREQYKPARQPRLRYLLEAIEKAKRTKLSEEVQIKSTLTIEHVMPRSWQEHWPLPDEALNRPGFAGGSNS